MRALDSLGDWTFGKGQNDYKVNLAAVAQNIQTRVLSFVGDCFFATNAGIDWFNLLGGKNQLNLQLAIAAVITNTPGVTRILLLNVNLDNNRKLSVQYNVQTTYSQGLNGLFTYDFGTTG